MCCQKQIVCVCDMDKKRMKPVTIKTTGNEKFGVTVMLTVLARGGKMPPYVMLRENKCQKRNYSWLHLFTTMKNSG